MRKAAVDMMTRCASVDLAPFGIRVNAVNPGVTVTELQKTGGLNAEQYAAFLKRSIEVTHPLAAALGRCAEPEEVANGQQYETTRDYYMCFYGSVMIPIGLVIGIGKYQNPTLRVGILM